jgi:ATP-dependent Clp endopeptidase proteolytic subunit ClpP
MKERQERQIFGGNKMHAESQNKNGGLKPGNANMRISRDHIWFYDSIDDETALEFNQVITDMATEHCKYTYNGMFEHSGPAPIWLHINSPGGVITSAMSMVDTINRIKHAVPIITIVEGCAASAGTFVSMVGSHRVIRENAYMLVHQLSGGAWGNFEQLKDNHENVSNFMKDIKKLYKQYTKIPVKELDDLLKHDLYMKASKCKMYGLVDEVII